MQNTSEICKKYKIRIEKIHKTAATDMPSSHAHPTYELYFLLSGERRYFVGHRIYDVCPGELVVIPKNEIHRTTAPGSVGYERYVVFFDDKCMDNLSNIIGGENCRTFMQSGCITLPPNCIDKIKSLLSMIASECMKVDELSDAIMFNALQGIIVCAMRYGKKKDCKMKNGADKIQEVAQYICDNYADDITLREMAQMAYMEQTYFSKKFKKLTGFSFKEYLIRTRVKAAQKLLSSSNLTISEISELCGYSGSNYFGDAFKKHTGVSPSEWKRNG